MDMCFISYEEKNEDIIECKDSSTFYDSSSSSNDDCSARTSATSPSSSCAFSSKYTDNSNRSSDSSLTTCHDFRSSDLADDEQPIDLSLKKQNERIRNCDDNRTMQQSQCTNEIYNNYLKKRTDGFPMFNFPVTSSMRGYSPWHHYMCSSPLSFIPPSSLPNWNAVSSINEMILPMNPLLYGLPITEVTPTSVATPNYYKTSQHLWKSFAAAGRADASLFRKFVATHNDAFHPNNLKAAPVFPSQELQLWNQQLKGRDNGKKRTDYDKESIDDQEIPKKLSPRVKNEGDDSVQQYNKSKMQYNSSGAAGQKCRSTDQHRYATEPGFIKTNSKYLFSNKSPIKRRNEDSSTWDEHYTDVISSAKKIKMDASPDTNEELIHTPVSDNTEVSNQSNGTSNNSGNLQMTPKPINFKPCRFHCTECGRTYATVGGLLKHSKYHHDPDNAMTFKCKTCEKEYTSLGALKMHIRTHTLPCKCHICGKAFSRTWLLQGHIRTHTGEKPYQCSVCLRAFADRSNLRAHMQTHQNVKRYACTGCEKTFSRTSLLNRHRASGCVP